MRAREAHWGTVVLTGATSGIGEATARRLAGRADELIVQGPEPEDEVAGVLAGIRASGSAHVRYLSVDFTSLTAVAEAARAVREAVSTVDLLINDAGVPGAPERLVTADGFERTLQVNALAPALFTRLLAPSLAEGARIVNVGSSAHRVADLDLADPDLVAGYTPVTAYSRAKLAMVTWSSLLAKEFGSEPVTVVALCPGLNETPLSAAMAGPIGGPPTVGAERVLFAAAADVPSGSYLEGDRVVPTSAASRDPRNRRRLAELYLERLPRFASYRPGRRTGSTS
ncbi:SDR family NAD(P)-dependent oxidoreductase [Promicromonospora sp. MEB111]|uniref:SDR family NAD(P)-dependent oxidoreductase n=1 Tax=Promicromonospora sp. MEB111 TaxID=3040301 RepID=UPI00254E805D|nr:SDR family NAD(P)-dependent oxidoreductase [Promicromonospora sp. MEB111]